MKICGDTLMVESDPKMDIGIMKLSTPEGIVFKKLLIPGAGTMKPFRLKDDDKDVVCQLEPNHGGLLHAWCHRLHVTKGRHQQGFIVWPTDEGAHALASGAISHDVLHSDEGQKGLTRLELNGRGR